MGIIDKVTRWSFESNEYLSIHRMLQFMDRILYSDYEPTQSARSGHGRFNTRLISWLNNVDKEAQQKQLFKILPHLLYLGRDEVAALMTSAFSSVYTQWIITSQSIRLSPSSFDHEYSEAVKHTWFCPVTDSFRINQFFHLNGLASIATHRPDWRALKKFGDPVRISDYARDNNFSRIVLLEDFIGTGTQVSSIVKFIGMNFPHLQFLILPLVCSMNGRNKVQDIITEKGYSNVSFRPVVLLDHHSTLSVLTSPNRKAILQGRKKLLEACDEKKRAEIDRFNLDLLSVLHSNTPNNALPELHVYNPKWNPLFPRVQRD